MKVKRWQLFVYLMLLFGTETMVSIGSHPDHRNKVNIQLINIVECKFGLASLKAMTLTVIVNR